MSGFIVFIIFIILFKFAKVVPPNTVYIIDRNSHYLKTKTNGFFFLLPNDQITTVISTTPQVRALKDYFELEDGTIINVTITCMYSTNNLENVLLALKNVRRSIDDIIKSSVYFAANCIKKQYLSTNPSFLENHVIDNLITELDSVNVKLDSCNLYYSITSHSNSSIAPFKPHIGGCYSENHSHEYAIKENRTSNDDNPITFY